MPSALSVVCCISLQIYGTGSLHESHCPFHVIRIMQGCPCQSVVSELRLGLYFCKVLRPSTENMLFCGFEAFIICVFELKYPKKNTGTRASLSEVTLTPVDSCNPSVLAGPGVA